MWIIPLAIYLIVMFICFVLGAAYQSGKDADDMINCVLRNMHLIQENKILKERLKTLEGTDTNVESPGI